VGGWVYVYVCVWVGGGHTCTTVRDDDLHGSQIEAVFSKRSRDEDWRNKAIELA
jgi:hypothetical protein